MNEILKKFSEEAKAKLIGALSTVAVADFVAKTKAAEDSGRFRVVISTADLDRQGEIVDQNGWDLKNYQQNPIVLWAHDYYSLPIGVCDKIGIEDVGSGRQGLVAEGKFAPMDANPFAQQVRKLYEAGIVRTTSVGFIAGEMQGNTVTKAELLEFSFVPVPANPYALSLAQVKELGLDTAMLAMKGLNIEEKADPPQEGDPCSLEGGAEGVMQPDGNGALVCMPKPKAAEPSPEEEKEAKAGRTLSEKTKTAINQAIDASKACTAALEELLTAAQLQGSEGEEKPGDEASPKQRSTPTGSATAGFDDWRFTREVLQAIATSASGALERFNKTARVQAQRK